MREFFECKVEVIFRNADKEISYHFACKISHFIFKILLIGAFVNNILLEFRSIGCTEIPDFLFLRPELEFWAFLRFLDFLDGNLIFSLPEFYVSRVQD